jgi:hypothetical protein
MFEYIEIKDRITDAVVKRIDVTAKSQRTIERVYAGIEINLNHAEYYVIVASSKDALELIDKC